MMIRALKHPEYLRSLENWGKWRLTFQGDENFRDTYLQQYSVRETPDDFKKRKQASYVPAFAAATLQEIVNSIFQRLNSINRIGGPASYQEAVSGRKGGVDLAGSSMNTFIGKQILPELLSMSRVGVFIDRQPIESNILTNVQNNSPYLYYYKAEDVLNWKCSFVDNELAYTNIVLRDTYDAYDERTGLPLGEKIRYRHMFLTREGVVVRLYGYLMNPDTHEEEEVLLQPETILPLTRIPFVMFGLSKSLLIYASNYQIGLLNLASSDLLYALRANFPFYVEQRDIRWNPPHLSNRVQVNSDDEIVENQESGDEEILQGTQTGRYYGKDMERPGFIHPSPQPLMASMKKQEQMKAEIRQLMNLALTTTEPMHASAESKAMDDRTLEGGLSAIGLELQHGENQIAKIWAEYENSKPATIFYPAKYSLLTESEKRAIVKELREIRDVVPSRLYRLAICKKIAKVELEDQLSKEDMDRILQQIDNARFISVDATEIETDFNIGLVDPVTACEARGYSDAEQTIEKAKTAHTERLTEIAKSQSSGALVDPANRGVKDLAGNPNDTQKGG